MAAKIEGLRAVETGMKMIDPLTQGMKKIEGGIDKGTDVMKEAATQQVEAIADATSAFGKGIKKSFKRHSKEMRGFARSFSELVDLEDILKSIHKVAYPEEHAKSSNIIHQPIDWSKYPPGSTMKPPDTASTSSDHSKSSDEAPISGDSADDSDTSENKLSAKGKAKLSARHSSPLPSPSKDRAGDDSLKVRHTSQGDCKGNISRHSSVKEPKGNHLSPSTNIIKEYAMRHLSPTRTRKEYPHQKLALKHQPECYDDSEINSQQSREYSRSHGSSSKASSNRSSREYSDRQVRHSKDISSIAPSHSNTPKDYSNGLPPTNPSKASLTRSSSLYHPNYHLDPNLSSTHSKDYPSGHAPAMKHLKELPAHKSFSMNSGSDYEDKPSKPTNSSKGLNRSASVHHTRDYSNDYSYLINQSPLNQSNDYLSVHTPCRKHSHESADCNRPSPNQKKSSLNRSASVNYGKVNSSHQSLQPKGRPCNRSASLRMPKAK